MGLNALAIALWAVCVVASAAASAALAATTLGLGISQRRQVYPKPYCKPYPESETL